LRIGICLRCLKGRHSTAIGYIQLVFLGSLGFYSMMFLIRSLFICIAFILLSCVGATAESDKGQIRAAFFRRRDVDIELKDDGTWIWWRDARTQPISTGKWTQNGNEISFAGTEREIGRLLGPSRSNFLGNNYTGVLANGKFTLSEIDPFDPFEVSSIDYKVPKQPKLKFLTGVPAPTPELVPQESQDRVNVEAELKEAQKQWEKDEQRKDDDFERIHKQKIEEWRTKLRAGQASYDDHPDVQIMQRLMGTEGILIAPSVAKEHDKILIDRGWYPIPLSQSQIETNIKEGRESHRERPDVPSEIKLPTYNAVRDHFLKGKDGK
jgi:hypothetical protein